MGVLPVLLLLLTIFQTGCCWNFTTGWQLMRDGRYWQDSVLVPPSGEAQFHFKIQNQSLPEIFFPIFALCAKLNVQPVDRPAEWKNFCQKDAYFEFHLNDTANSTCSIILRPGLYYLALGAWPLGNLSLSVSVDISATECMANMTGMDCADQIIDVPNDTVSDVIPANVTRFYRFEIADSLSALANLSFAPAAGLVVRARYLAAPTAEWFDAPSAWAAGWQAFARPAPGPWLVAVSAADRSQPTSVRLGLQLLPVPCEPPQTNCSPAVLNVTGVSSLSSQVPLTPVQYYAVYNRNGSEFRVSITDPDGLNSSATPSLYLKWGNLPAVDSWDAKDDGGPRLVKYIATNHTIEGNWYIAVWSDIPRPYALWLYTVCPNDCHEDMCIETGAKEGRCDCKDLVHSLDCAAQVPAAMEWGIVAALLVVTVLLILAGAAHYLIRRRHLTRQLQYAPIAANADS